MATTLETLRLAERIRDLAERLTASADRLAPWVEAREYDAIEVRVRRIEGQLERIEIGV